MVLLTDCIFCKIIKKELNATVILERDDLLVIKDIAPRAPIHYLIIPKHHVENVSALQADDADIIAPMFLAARDVAKKLSGSQAFQLVLNNGAEAGQSVFHLHMHFISGERVIDL